MNWLEFTKSFQTINTHQMSEVCNHASTETLSHVQIFGCSSQHIEAPISTNRPAISGNKK